MNLLKKKRSQEKNHIKQTVKLYSVVKKKKLKVSEFVYTVG